MRNFIAGFRSGHSKSRTGLLVRWRTSPSRRWWAQTSLLTPGTNGVNDKALYGLCQELTDKLAPWNVAVSVIVVDQWTLALEAYMINGAMIRRYLSLAMDRKALEYAKIGFIHLCLDSTEL